MIGKPAERFEARLMTSGGALLLILAALFALFPRGGCALCMFFVRGGGGCLDAPTPLLRAEGAREGLRLLAWVALWRPGELLRDAWYLLTRDAT